MAYDSAESIIKHFRVDKILDLQRTGEPRDGKDVFAAVDMAEYANAHFGMFSGREENIRLEFRNDLAGRSSTASARRPCWCPAGRGISPSSSPRR